MPKACTNATKTEFIKYIFSNHLFKKSSDVASSVLPKAQVCPTLDSSCLCRVGGLQGPKWRIYIPPILSEFYGIYSIKNPLF